MSSGIPSFHCLYCKITLRNTTSRKVLAHLKAYHHGHNGPFSSIPEGVATSAATCSTNIDVHVDAVESESLSTTGNDGTQSQLPNSDEDQTAATVDVVAAGMTDSSSTDSNGFNIHVSNFDCNHAAAYKYLLTLYSKGSTTRKQIQESVDCTSALMETSAAVLSSALSNFVQSLPQEVLHDNTSSAKLDSLNNCIEMLAKPFTKFETESQRLDMFQRETLVMPVSYHVGYRTEKRNDGLFKIVSSTAQYVPIITTLKNHIILSKQRELPTPTCIISDQLPDGLIRGYTDGDCFKKSGYFKEHPSALRLQLYHDDIEVANPLGSKAGVHKLTMFYYSIEGRRHSKLQSIHLVIVAYAADVKQYGYDCIMKPLIDDLKVLDEGIDMRLQSGEKVTLRARLIQLLGDNLAANQILGLVQSFKADHFCRFCMMASNESKKAIEIDLTCLRNRHEHAVHLSQVAEDISSVKSHGVKAPCALDQLSYFCGVESSVPDCMHDILEGVGKKELKLLLNSLVAKKLLTLHEFNSRLVAMTYWRHESSDKPSAQINFDSIKQTATQTWCLLRYLPFMIGDLVPFEDPQWQVYLRLRRVMDLVMSPTITQEGTYACEAAISEHHAMFLEAYPNENLSPKHHFMLHYGTIMRAHGPLCSYWCMRFEAKHRLAKTVASVSCNFKNMPLTVAERYQLQSFAQAGLDEQSGDDDQHIDIRVGDVVHVRLDENLDDEPRFGEVMKIEADGSVVVALLNTAYDVHMHSYNIIERLLDDFQAIRMTEEQQKISVDLLLTATKDYL